MRLVLFISCFFIVSNLSAQKAVRFGYYINPSLNLYQRVHLPNNLMVDGADRSLGQGLNLLPDLSAGLWVGQAKDWAIGLEAGLGYLPFSLNLQNYQGMGSLQVPLMLRAFLPLKQQHSTAIHMNLATGVQINKTHIFSSANAPAEIRSNFNTYLAEISGGFAAISQKSTQIRGLDLFFRFGFGANQAMSFQTGLRIHFWNSFKQ